MRIIPSLSTIKSFFQSSKAQAKPSKIQKAADKIFGQQQSSVEKKGSWVARKLSQIKGIFRKTDAAGSSIKPQTVGGEIKTKQTFRYGDGYNGPDGLMNSVQADQLQKDLTRATYYVNGKKVEFQLPPGLDENKQKVEMEKKFIQLLQDEGLSEGEIESVKVFAQQGISAWVGAEMKKDGLIVRAGQYSPMLENYSINTSGEKVEITRNSIMLLTDPDAEDSNGKKVGKTTGVFFSQSKALVPRGLIKDECIKSTVINYTACSQVKFDNPADMEVDDLPEFDEKAQMALDFAAKEIEGFDEPPLINKKPGVEKKEFVRRTDFAHLKTKWPNLLDKASSIKIFGQEIVPIKGNATIRRAILDGVEHNQKQFSQNLMSIFGERGIGKHLDNINEISGLENPKLQRQDWSIDKDSKDIVVAIKTRIIGTDSGQEKIVHAVREIRIPENLLKTGGLGTSDDIDTLALKYFRGSEGSSGIAITDMLVEE